MKNKYKILEQSRVNAIVQRFIDARGVIQDAKQEIEFCRAELKKLRGTGKHNGFTIYKVKEHTIREHIRSGFTALRGKTVR